MGRDPTADIYIYTRTSSQPGSLQNFLFPGVRKRNNQNTEDAAKRSRHKQARRSAGRRAREAVSSRAPRRGAPGLGRGRRWPRPRSLRRPRSRPAGQRSRGGRGAPPARRPKVPPAPRRQSRLPLTLSPVHHLLRAPLGHWLHGGCEPAGTSPRDRPQLLGPRTRPLSRSHPGSAAPARPVPGPAPPAGHGRARPAAAPPPGACPARPGPDSCLGKCREKSSWASGSDRSADTAIREPPGIAPRERRAGRGVERRPGAAPRFGGGSV